MPMYTVTAKNTETLKQTTLQVAAGSEAKALEAVTAVYADAGFPQWVAAGVVASHPILQDSL